MSEICPASSRFNAFFNRRDVRFSLRHRENKAITEPSRKVFSLTPIEPYVKRCAMSATEVAAFPNYLSLPGLDLIDSLLIQPIAPLFAELLRNLASNHGPCSTIRVQEVMRRRYGFHQYLFKTIRFRQHDASRRMVASTAARLSRSFRFYSLFNLGSVPRQPLSLRSLPVAVLLP